MKAADIKTAYDVPLDQDPDFTLPTNAWDCECGRIVERYRGMDDILCECGQWYNSFGNRLRNDWMDNPALYDDTISDMEGFEREQLAKDRDLDDF